MHSESLVNNLYYAIVKAEEAAEHSMSVPFFHNIPFFSIFLVMIVAIILPLVKNGRVALSISAISAAVVTVMSAVLLYNVYQTGESFDFAMGHFPAPWGNELRAGVLEALMATFISFVMVLCILGGFRIAMNDIQPEKQNINALMLNMRFASIIALIYTNDVFTAYVFIEIGEITACAVAMTKETGKGIVATIRYLIMNSMGSGLFLIGISIMYTITGQLLIPDMANAVANLIQTGEYNTALSVAICLITVGIGVKSALFPFHTWLSWAHANATTASMCISSGLVLKGYIILLIKLILRVFTLDYVNHINLTLGLLIFGLIGMVYASVRAIKEKNSKRMVAFSSVAQIGYIYMGIGIGTEYAIAAACFQILAHAVTKPMLFTSVGQFCAARGEKEEWHDLKGVARNKPLAGIAYTIGSLSMCGVPLFAGFSAKYYLSASAVESGEPFALWASLIIIGVSAVLNAMYYLPSTILIWSRTDKDEKKADIIPSPKAYNFSTICFIALNFLLGLAFTPIFKLIEKGLEMLTQ